MENKRPAEMNKNVRTVCARVRDIPARREHTAAQVANAKSANTEKRLKQ